MTRQVAQRNRHAAPAYTHVYEAIANRLGTAGKAAKLMLLLVASFVTLVPGRLIETRDSSGLGGPDFWILNVFLIVLELLAIASSVAMLRSRTRAAIGAIAAAWGYVFPTSPDPILLMLGLIVILVFMLAPYVMALAHRALGHI